MEARCMKCGQPREMKDTTIETNEKGTRMMRGVCPVCGTKMVRFLPKDYQG